MLNLPSYHSTNYPLAVKEQMTKVIQEEYTDEVKKILKLSQFIGKEFYVKSGVRGILGCLGTGQGKTRFLSAVVNDIHARDPTRRVIVLSAKSLEANAVRNIAEYMHESEETIRARYSFISLNASNMFKQVANVDKDRDELDFENRLGSFMDDVSRENSLEHSLLIIDEAHNLFNSIINGAKNALALYDLIMNARDIRLLFLTGTPIVNDPVELVACFNMCRGFMDAKSARTTLFSEYINEFEEYFVDRANHSVKNRDKFMNRIYGLTSYYGDLYFVENMKDGFPQELPMIIEKVPMSETQFARYAFARGKELEESKQPRARGPASRFSTASSSSASSYRVQSRQISNYCIPEYALGPARGKKAREKFLNRITDQDLVDMARWSPKFERIVRNVEKFTHGPGLIYSQFVSGEGIELFARVLETRGYHAYSVESTRGGKQSKRAPKHKMENAPDHKMEYADEYGIKHGIKHAGINPESSANANANAKTYANAKSYAILSGNVSPEDRVKIVKAFNQKENADGSIIHLILISSAGAEGLDLKRIRHVHIMECFWNFARINQVKARAIRYLSHADLPEDQRTVQVYIYLSDYPLDYPKNKIKELTTDLDMYNKSINNMKIINAFMLALAESSFDCSLHYPHLDAQIKEKISCKMCSPDDQELFNPDINRDLTLPNNCKAFSEKQITANEIVYVPTGEKFYYKIGPGGPLVDLDVYMFSKKLRGYIPMPRDYPHYGSIIEMIIEANLHTADLRDTNLSDAESENGERAEVRAGAESASENEEEKASDAPRDTRENTTMNTRDASHFPRWVIKQDSDYKYFITTVGSINYSLMPFHKNQVRDFIKKYYAESRGDLPHTIVDASAHIGVDTINFASLYTDANIISYEFNPKTYEILKKNVETFCQVKQWNPARFSVRQGDIVHALLHDHNLKCDMLFFDPPWGGKDYKKYDKMSLHYVSSGQSYNVSDLICEYLERNPKTCVMLRTPYNYKFSDIQRNKIIAREMILTNNRDAYYMCCIIRGPRDA